MQLLLPSDFNDHGWEIKAKGYFVADVVTDDGIRVSVSFYDPVRLAQDIEADMAELGMAVVTNLVVVEAVTPQQMLRAIARLRPGQILD